MKILSKTLPDERWIYIKIKPEDPYRSRVGYFEENNYRFYCIEELKIFLSSQGRAYQQTLWNSILRSDIHPVQEPAYCYLKQFPQEEGLVKFEEDPVDSIIRPLEPVRGRTLDRLAILRSNLQQGTVIEEGHS